MKICASCKPEGDFNHVSFSVSLPQWLEQTNFVKNFIQSMKSEKKITRTTKHLLYEIQFHDSMKGKVLLLWATRPSDSIRIKDAKSAYHNFENHQIGKISGNGKLKVFLQVPELYYVLEKKKKVVYPRHFHFVIRDTHEWNTQVYTHIVTPVVKKSFVKKRLKDKKAVLVNSLPKSMFQETKIHQNVINIPEEILSEKRKAYLRRKLVSFVKDKNPKIYELVRSKQLTVKNIPMIVYCKSNECNSSEKWITKMLELGFYNLYIYKGGYDDFCNEKQ